MITTLDTVLKSPIIKSVLNKTDHSGSEMAVEKALNMYGVVGCTQLTVEAFIGLNTTVMKEQDYPSYKEYIDAKETILKSGLIQGGGCEVCTCSPGVDCPYKAEPIT
jgi:hypothetical protein